MNHFFSRLIATFISLIGSLIIIWKYDVWLFFAILCFLGSMAILIDVVMDEK